MARVELGSQAYATTARLNGQPCAIIALYQLPGTNALTTAEGVRKLMMKASESFPTGMDILPTSESGRVL